MKLPNVRKLFIPDPGYIIGEADLSGADAQVYAWDANDLDLMEAFQKGLKIHLKNAKDVFPDRTRGMSDDAIKAQNMPGGIYYDCKRAVHATTYGVQAKSLAGKLGWTNMEAERFQHRWFGVHPAIKKWQDRIKDDLFGRTPGNPARTIYNKFGYRIIFFDRIDSCYTEALAWIPQSTVAINCIKSSLALREKCSSFCQILLQVHDSLVFQFKEDDMDKLPLIKTALHTTIVPYSPIPLNIPWGLKLSSKSWGDGEDVKW